MYWFTKKCEKCDKKIWMEKTGHRIQVKNDEAWESNWEDEWFCVSCSLYQPAYMSKHKSLTSPRNRPVTKETR